MEKTDKRERCKFGFPDLVGISGEVKVVYKCLHKNCKIEDKVICEKCEDFISRYIEYPIEISAIDTKNFNNDGMYSRRIGELVKIRPCAEEYKGKTFVGILLGDLITSPHISYNNETKVLNINAMTNPAIFVPELNKIVYGYESWWGEIKDKNDLSDINISDEDIENVWYVKMLKTLYNKSENQ